jgi:TetR/AcrR family transcriptional regulator, mexCD-oprJ operon repressor
MSQPESRPTPLHPAPRQALQQRVSAAILDAAARVLVGRGEQASMNDVAAAAGVARATVYRYFPSRQALLDELARLAVRDAAERLASARIDEVAAEEGVRRAIRALVDVGDYFAVLARERVQPDAQEFERGLAAPLRRLFERGAAAGEVRQDIPSSWLTNSLVGLVVSVLPSTPALGKEDTIAAITGLFFDGIRAPGRQRGEP